MPLNAYHKNSESHANENLFPPNLRRKKKATHAKIHAQKTR